MTKRAVVTGGAGFIGGAVRRGLADDGWKVTAIDVKAGPDVVIDDVTRPGSWQDLLVEADAVVHCAAVLADVEDAAAQQQVNVTGTAVVMQACADAGVGRVLHTSATAVLGNDFEDRADETTPIRMTGNPYTDSKVAAEHQALMFAARGLPVTVLRPGEVYGPHSGLWTVRVVTLIKQRMFALVDDGQGVMSPIYVDDYVSGVLAALRTPAAIGEIIHLTGGEGISASIFFGAYAAMLDRSIPTLPRAALGPLATGAQMIARPLGFPAPLSGRALEFLTRPGTFSIAKAHALLGWQPEISLEEGMARTQLWLDDVGLL